MAAAAAAAAAADVVDDKDDSSSSSGPLPSVPVTETPNELTENIDVVDAVGLVRLLRGADAQIFSGYQHHPGLFDARVLRAAEQVVSATTRLLRLLTSSPAPATGATAPPPRPIVVMTGCGTSGRIAYFVARAFNRTLRALLPSTATAPVFHYLVSGGDTALLESEELPEDDPVTGAKELADLVTRTRATHLLCVGITCGLSAPYVAGQLDWCMAQQQSAAATTAAGKSATAAGATSSASTLQEVTTVLMGFNPLALARRAPIELWHGGRTFYDVAHQLASRSRNDGQHHIVLNPVVGPEPVTGSSRMKGGSVTKLLLESVFSGALWHVFGPDAPGPYGAQVSLAVPRALGVGAGPGAGVLVDLLTSFESSALRHTYLCGDALSRIVSLASDSLRHDSSSSGATGHLYYLGEGDGAVMAFIDASEMPDTYGTPHTDVRAFVCGGWSTMANARGDLSHHNPLFRIGPQHFVSDVLPRVTARDTVVVVTDQQRGDIHVELRRLAALAQAKGAKVALVAVTAATAASAGSAVAAAEATGSTHGATVVGHKRPHSSIGPSAPRQFKEQKDHGGAAVSAPAAAAAAPDDGHRLKKHKTDLYWPPTRADSNAAAAAAASAGTASAASTSSTAGATAAAAVTSDTNTVSTADGTDVVFDAVCHIELPYSGLLRDSTGGSSSSSGGVGDRFRCHALTAQATKWVLNAITTGAHVRNGSVLRNRMINMTVANNKLYHRAVRIVVDSVRAVVVGAGPAVHLTDGDAERCLLRAIHSVDVVDATLMAQRTSQHIITATKVAHVIPVAILLASGDARFATVAQARAALRTQANVRLLLRGAAAK